jgi:hypothetical protein
MRLTRIGHRGRCASRIHGLEWVLSARASVAPRRFPLPTNSISSNCDVRTECDAKVLAASLLVHGADSNDDVRTHNPAPNVLEIVRI